MTIEPPNTALRNFQDKTSFSIRRSIFNNSHSRLFESDELDTLTPTIALHCIADRFAENYIYLESDGLKRFPGTSKLTNGVTELLFLRPKEILLPKNVINFIQNSII